MAGCFDLVLEQRHFALPSMFDCPARMKTLMGVCSAANKVDVEAAVKTRR